MERKRLTSRQKWMIVDLKKVKVPDKKVIELFHENFDRIKCRSSINDLMNRYNQRGTVDTPLIKGRPRKFSDDELDNLVDSVKMMPFRCLDEIVNDRSANPNNATDRSIRFALKSRNIRTYSINKNRVNHISYDNIDRRIEFGLSVINWTVED